MTLAYCYKTGLHQKKVIKLDEQTRKIRTCWMWIFLRTVNMTLCISYFGEWSILPIWWANWTVMINRIPVWRTDYNQSSQRFSSVGLLSLYRDAKRRANNLFGHVYYSNHANSTIIILLLKYVTNKSPCSLKKSTMLIDTE